MALLWCVLLTVPTSHDPRQPLHCEPDRLYARSVTAAFVGDLRLRFVRDQVGSVPSSEGICHTSLRQLLERLNIQYPDGTIV
jgi:hypothetical protein